MTGLDPNTANMLVVSSLYTHIQVSVIKSCQNLDSSAANPALVEGHIYCQNCLSCFDDSLRRHTSCVTSFSNRQILSAAADLLKPSNAEINRNFPFHLSGLMFTVLDWQREFAKQFRQAVTCLTFFNNSVFNRKNPFQTQSQKKENVVCSFKLHLYSLFF